MQHMLNQIKASHTNFILIFVFINSVALQKTVKFKDFLRPLSDFQVLFKARPLYKSV